MAGAAPGGLSLPLSDAERDSLSRILRGGLEEEVQASRLQGFLGRYIHCDAERVDWVSLAEAVLRSAA